MNESIPLKILIIAVHFEVTGARYIADAFQRLGHDVKHIGQSARLKDVWGVDVADKYIWQPDTLTSDWQPELVIIADTLVNVDLSQFTAPVIYWSNDNHVRNVRRDGIAHYFLAHKHGKAQPVQHPDEIWLPCAADTHVFTPSRIRWNEREYDVCLVGVMYERRARLVKMLRNAGLKVFAETGLVYEEYRNAYHNSRISLCVSANGDLAQRVFETSAMGCLVLTDVLDDLSFDEDANAELGLSGFSVYQNDEDCVTWAKTLTANKKLAQSGAITMQSIVREFHTWEHRAQVVIDWYQATYGKVEMNSTADDYHAQLMTTMKPDDPLLPRFETPKEYRDDGTNLSELRPYLNLGCGKTHLPSKPPMGHDAVAQYSPSLYTYPRWENVDKLEGVGADKVFDLFTYPWPLEDNSYDGALLAHIVEHIPHEIKLANDSQRANELALAQDGWYAFFSELYRVLTNGSIVHILAPYGHSHGAITDPSHTRYLTEATFTHSMTPNADGATFQYNNGGIHFELDDLPYYETNELTEIVRQRTGFPIDVLLMLYNNVCFNFYVKLKVVK